MPSHKSSMTRVNKCNGSDIDQEIFTQKALEKRDITDLPFSEDNIEKNKSLLQVMHLAMIMKKLRKQKS